MKTPQELFDENYKGFACTSVKEAYRKGFIAGIEVAKKLLKEEVKKLRRE